MRGDAKEEHRKIPGVWTLEIPEGLSDAIGKKVAGVESSWKVGHGIQLGGSSVR